MDMQNLKKVIVDEMGIAYNPNSFFFTLRVGDTWTAYVLDPAGAKAFAENLNNRIAEFEKQNGPVDSSGRNQGIVSPMQPK